MAGDRANVAKAVIRVLNPASSAKLQGKTKNRSLNPLEQTRNVLENGAGFGGERDDGGDGLEVQYNPSTLRISQQVEERTGVGENGAGKNVAGNCTRTMEVELLFTGAEDTEKHAVKKKVESFLALMMHSPDHRISFSWGKLICQGCVTGMNASYDLFDGEGDPLSGTVKLTVREDPE